MYVSEKQIESVTKALKDNEYRLSDGYKYYYSYDKEHNFRPDGMSIEEARSFDVDFVLKEVAIEIINNLNEVIYYKGT